MSPCRILVVEDEAVIALDIEERLKAIGYELAGRAETAKRALELTGQEQPDLVLMDIRLQGNGDGITAACEIKAQYRIPVIFLTAYSEEATLEKAKTAEPFGYILKPFDDRELRSVIEIALYKHKAEREIYLLNRLYDVLSQVNQSISRTQTRDELLNTVCRLLVERGEMNLAWIGWLDHGTKKIDPVASFGTHRNIFANTENYANDRPEGEGNVGKAIRAGESFICNECSSTNCLYPAEQAPSKFGFESCGSFPIRFQGQVCASLNLCIEQPDFFHERQIELLREVALDLSFALDKMESDAKRKAAERSLWDSEARYRTLIEKAPEAIFVQHDGRFVYVNPVMADLLGAAGPEGLLGREIMTYIAPEYHEAVRQRIAIQRKTGHPTPLMEQEYFRMDGSRVPVETTAVFTQYQGSDAHLVFVRDVSERKRTEEELRKIESNYREIFNATSEAIFVHDADTGKILDVNDAMLRMFGYDSKDEILHETNLGALSAGGPFSMEKALGRISLSIEQGPQVFEWGARKKNGDLFRVEVSLRGFEIGGNKRILAVVRDITERRQAEDALKASEEKYRLLVETSSDGIMSVDGDDVITYVNTAMAGMLGDLPAKIIGRKIEHFLFTDDLASHAQRMKDRRSGEDERYERRFRRHDGSEIWARISAKALKGSEGQFAGSFAMVTDITERKKSEAERELLIKAIEQAAEVVVITDDKGNIQYVNPVFEVTTGYTKQEALGQNPSILKSGQHDPEFYKKMWETISSGQTWHGRLVNKNKDGAFYTEEATISPIRDQTGAIRNYVAVKHNISKEIALEEQFLQAQKMEVVGQLAGGIAHDFNNILSAITGYGYLAQTQIEADNPVQKDISEIIAAANRAAEVTHSLLAFSRKQLIKLLPKDINDLVRKSVKMLSRFIGEDIETVIDLSDKELVCMVDTAQIDQVLMNMATNARDAMPNGGMFTLRTSIVTADRTIIDHKQIKRQPYAMVSISDTGTGMAPSTVSKIFEPFYTTKATGKGTGLGLAMVHGIINQLDGHIEVKSEPGKGTTFFIYLPLIELSEKIVEQGQLSIPVGRGETILVAEDDPTLRNLYHAIFTTNGYRVILASDGNEAISQFNKNRNKTKLILLDMIMPKKSGRKTYEAIKKMGTAVNFLFVTGYTADRGDREALQNEGVSFMTKPASPSDLLRRVRELLDKS